ncbi:hypothetical protein N9159_00530 [bacterium]|nr:hypothetical protein [bacterium]
MAQTVTEVLTAGADSVTLINAINGGTQDVTGMTQAEINEMVQRNIDHLETVLAYAPVDGNDTPDVAGAASNLKTTHVAAVSTGKTYITDNS